jgi:hypothetical protein
MTLFSPEESRRIERSWWYRKTRALSWVFGWARNLPIITVGATFWVGVADEGLRSTLAPRWGLLTFHFLNDGMRPTIWHTVQSVLHPGDVGIWHPRAPRSQADADAITEYYRSKRRDPTAL